jgi:hypothetical protein
MAQLNAAKPYAVAPLCPGLRVERLAPLSPKTHPPQPTVSPTKKREAGT